MRYHGMDRPIQWYITFYDKNVNPLHAELISRCIYLFLHSTPFLKTDMMHEIHSKVASATVNMTPNDHGLAGKHLLITVLADDLASNGMRASVGTVLTTNLDMTIYQSFFGFFIFWIHFYRLVIIRIFFFKMICCWDPIKSCTLSIIFLISHYFRIPVHLLALHHVLQRVQGQLDKIKKYVKELITCFHFPKSPTGHFPRDCSRAYLSVNQSPRLVGPGAACQLGLIRPHGSTWCWLPGLS